MDPLEGSGTKGLAQVSCFDSDADLEFQAGQPDEGPSYRRDGLPIKQAVKNKIKVIKHCKCDLVRD